MKSILFSFMSTTITVMLMFSEAGATSLEIKTKVLTLQGDSAGVLLKKIKKAAFTINSSKLLNYRASKCRYGNQSASVGNILSCQNKYDHECALYPSEQSHSCSLIIPAVTSGANQAELQIIFDLLPGDAEPVTDEGLLGSNTLSKSFGGIHCTSITLIHPDAKSIYDCRQENSFIQDSQGDDRIDAIRVGSESGRAAVSAQ